VRNGQGPAENSAERIAAPRYDGLAFNPKQELTMTTKDNKTEGELSEAQLDGVSGGQEVKKMGTIVVEAKRLPPEQQVVKMETIVVTASREKPDTSGTRVAAVTPKKN
jgi:hypothetical protein